MQHQKYLKDIEASRALAEKYSRLIYKGECFNNVARLCLQEGICMVYPDWRIAYGFVGTRKSGLYFVHAFFLDTCTQRVIDPTVPEKVSAEAFQNGYYIALLLGYGEYLGAFAENKNPGAWQNPAFAIPCRELARWGSEHGMAFGG